MKIYLAQINTIVGDLEGNSAKVLQEFKKVLANAQVSEVETIGKSFDFHSMEAVETVETADEAQNDLVAKELQAGYRIFDKVVRPARVAVYKLSNKDSKEEN
jgi:molecular chaperone GrpE (heat shock protein)